MPLVTVVGTNESGSVSASFNVTVNEPSGPNPADYGQVIANQSFPSGLSLDGVTNRAYVNCTFGSMVQLRNCHHLLFLGGTRIGGAERGFKIRETGSPCSDVIFSGITIRDIQGDGFLISNQSGPHTGVQIMDCRLDNIGIAPAAVGSGLVHGIYSWTEVYFARNRVTRCVGGNGVSLRGGGVVEGNWIADCQKGGITYFGDHPAGPSNRYVIRGNAVTVPNPGGGYADITLLTPPTASYRVGNFEIRDNVITRPVMIGSGYGGAVITQSNNQIRTDAQVRALFPAG